MDSTSNVNMLDEHIKKLSLQDDTKAVTSKNTALDSPLDTNMGRAMRKKDTANRTTKISPTHRYNLRSSGTHGTPSTTRGSTYTPPCQRNKQATHIRFNDTSMDSRAPSNSNPTNAQRRTRRQKRLESAPAAQNDGAPQHIQQLAVRPKRSVPRLHMMERPTPTPAYLQAAFQQPQLLKSPRPLLVILDLNGTLLFRKNRGSSFIARPHVYSFLEYIFSNHLVMVWSSARPENVTKMCEDLFTPEQQAQLVAVWARDKLNLTPAAYKEKVQVYKQLSWVWNDTSIEGKKSWTQADTVLIDDSVEKAASEPYNLLRIDEFEGKPEQMKTDVLSQVTDYLGQLQLQCDVSAFMRTRPFQSTSTAA